MMMFYMVQSGKHVSRFFSHVFIRPEGNFYEYALHHALSAYLIFFSYLGNMWLIGIMVLFLHDTTDFLLIICRSYRVPIDLFRTTSTEKNGSLQSWNSPASHFGPPGEFSSSLHAVSTQVFRVCPKCHTIPNFQKRWSTRCTIQWRSWL